MKFPYLKVLLLLLVALIFALYLINKSKPLELTNETLSEEKIISVVRNLPEVKNFFKVSQEATGSSTKYDPQIMVEKHEDGLWYLWVFENVRYDTGIGHATTFNRYILDETSKIKCSYAIYDGIKLVRVSSNEEYPCK